MSDDPPVVPSGTPHRHLLEEKVDELRRELFKMERELKQGEAYTNFDADLLVYQVMMRSVSEESLDALAKNLRHWIDAEGHRRHFEDSGGPSSD